LRFFFRQDTFKIKFLGTDMSEDEDNAKKNAKKLKKSSKDDQLKSSSEPSDEIKAKLKAAIFARQSAFYAKAHDILSALLKEKPGLILAQKQLAILYLTTENYNVAENFLIGLEKNSNDKLWIYQALSDIYKKTNDTSKHINLLKKYLDIHFDQLVAQQLFDLQKNAGDIEGALHTISSLRSFKDHIELEAAEAKLTALLGKREDAQKMCDAMLLKRPIPVGAVELFMAINLGDLNNPEAITNKFEPMIQEGLNVPIVFVAMAKALHRMEQYQGAIDYLNKAIALENSHADWWYDLSLIYRQLGKLKESQDTLMQAIRLNPLNPTAIRVFGVEHKYTLGEEAHQHLNYCHAHDHLLKGTKKVELYMALAKAFEDFGELKTAFKYYDHVSELQAKLNPYKHSGTLHLLKMTRDRVTQATYANFNQPTNDSDKPVFVLGMPRSGTSLVEQVIASHPNAHGAGELKLLHRVIEGITINHRTLETMPNQPNVIPTFIKGIDLNHCRTLTFKERGDLYVKAIETLAELSGKKEVLRVVDKMPGNYFWTGVIPFILPHAKIIHTERHPLDNCLSLYRIYFPDGMPWSYSLTNLGKVYRSCYEHMKYWQSNLPSHTMITINYELMVNDFDQHAKNIISHIGLPWDETCLKFYETERQVKTASLNQVRKPIYTSSVGRWKKYEEFLKPLIVELGPIIKEYEDFIHERSS